MHRLVAIALSGGIDSLVSAALLKEQGHELIGLHFITSLEMGLKDSPEGEPPPESWQTLEDRAKRFLCPMADQLRIPLQIVDLRNEFQNLVIDYFTATYQAGKTPNPCLVCNQSIKFNILFKKARSWGATHLATGHYARVQPGADGYMHLLRGVDPVKEQSYFLSRLSQEQLARAIFPLGAHTKTQTRRMAKERGLHPAVSQESQDICFIRDGAYGDFLSRQPGFNACPGIIEDLKGKPIGHHNGLHQFTVGQRRGINCPAAEPYYVVRLDVERNTLVVGPRQSLLTDRFWVSGINWITRCPKTAIRISVRVRYRHAAIPATLFPVDDSSAEVRCETPQSAVTPGQGAVFYDDEEVLGGGWIE